MISVRTGGFDRIAPLYDALATMVFCDAIRKAELYFLSEVGKAGRLLILGGGTGRVLSDLHTTNPHCEIWYVDSSLAMIRIAKSNIIDFPNAHIHFIHGTQAQLPLGVKYDAVIANFYFDLFSTPTLKQSLEEIHHALLPDGKLLVADFTKNNLWWQSALLAFMYFFFRGICKIEATELPDWQRQLAGHNFQLRASQVFYGNFIKSAVYEREVH